MSQTTLLRSDTRTFSIWDKTQLIDVDYAITCHHPECDGQKTSLDVANASSARVIARRHGSEHQTRDAKTRFVIEVIGE